MLTQIILIEILLMFMKNRQYNDLSGNIQDLSENVINKINDL